MAFTFKLPSFGKATEAADVTSFVPSSIMDKPPPLREPAPGSAGQGSPLAVLDRLPMAKRLQILGAVLLVVVALMALLIVRDNREASFGTAYLTTAAELRMLSQRLAKAVAQSLQGDAAAFAQLKDARSKFAEYVDRLANGGEMAGVTVPPLPDGARAQIDGLAATWAKTDADTATVISQEKNLVNLGRQVAAINAKNAQLQQLTEQFAALRGQGAASAREIGLANQMVVLTQRIAKNANALLVGDAFDPAAALALANDGKTFGELVAAFGRGSEALKVAAVADGESRQRLADIEKNLAGDLAAIGAILADMQKLVQAKQAGVRIAKDSETLLIASAQLGEAIQDTLAHRTGSMTGMVLLALLAIGLVALMAKVFFEDQARQARLVEVQRREADNTNRANQDAILRLMNELGDLADGDLTVNATVSEDITGAIADSINYTIEELRVLVGRINDAASRVTQATGIARQTSAELLDAAERQSSEIQHAGRAALDMARSMTQVSNHATQSAQVARQSLAAAEKGAVAVQDSIKGMNEIRNQIQETSKRIKRLGESSQEIGEIVELISDITEQTNVLALNAAIQAASAGEAGRGFTVVAEEVQRLAERSGEATKQIGAIVKTIQTDTQDAVSAMEESTQGVVEGARLSDAAGQALTEIGQVSRNLAQLIENISTATQNQSNSASGVAETMQKILQINEQTTVGTQKTATMVGELSDLATELKGSIAGFKVG